jgi:hypothetical protein
MAKEEKVVATDEQKLATIDEKIGKGEELTPEEQALLGDEPGPDGDIEVVKDNEYDEDPEASDAPKKDEDTPDEGDDEGKDEPTDKAKESDETATDAEKESKDKVEAELAKPDDAQDLSKFNENETALYWELKRERRSRQKAESERDLLRLDKAREAKKTEEAKETPDEIEDMLKDRDDDDFLSIAETKKLLASLKKAPAQQEQAQDQGDPIRQGYIKMCDDTARATLTDYDDVMECTEIMESNPIYKVEIAKAVQEGKNPAIVAYHLIKGDPDFPKTLPIAQARIAARGDKPKAAAKPKVDPEKAKKAKEAEAKIEKNQTKVKTSGHYGSGTPDGGSGELTEQEVLDMSDAEFAALPKKTRDSLLKKFGV